MIATCLLCVDDRPHAAHWWDNCCCAASGFGTEHSDHCCLYGAQFIADDELLVDIHEYYK